ncbi:type II secretion system protein GspM [Brevundimonas sp.]|jgi:general secretion pathway protein M|uniref:type II secretion system protein GspM n=1 Tax=Brevundimonas sp. TaxID=1871086 RepID=UPI002E154E8F|nr:type II secretion system protein GspM [Brevundimonas sp.]
MSRFGSPVVVQAAEWFAARSARERLLLKVLAALGLVALLWYGVIQPLASARAAAMERIALHETLQARLKQGPPGVAAAVPTAALAEGSLVEAARAAAAAQGVAAQIDGDAERITVAAQGVRFEAAMPFVRALEAGGSELSDVRMQASVQPGLIDLTLTATRP